MNETLSRVAAPASLVAFSLLCLALPMLRHRLTHGSGSGFVIARLTDPADRAIGYAMTTNSNLVMLHALAFAALGPRPLSGCTSAPTWVGLVGVGLVVAAIGLVMTSQATMGRSWRMCVDDRPTSLVTDGPFALVRNPIYVGTILLNTGVAVITQTPWAVMILYAGAWFVAIQARREETHLEQLHGEAYRDYAARVGRFVPGVGLLRTNA